MLVLAGLPLFFLELALGQFASEGPITVWKISPIFTGIGFGMVTISALVSVYYNVIIMWSIYYMFVSFVSLDGDLPWQSCNNTWNTPSCRLKAYPDLGNMTEAKKMDTIFGELYNKTCLSSMVNKTAEKFNLSGLTFDMMNSTLIIDKVNDDCKTRYTTGAQEYWSNYVLRVDQSSGVGDLGDISLKNILTLLVAWILIFACLMKGIKSSGKVVYFTATFPYVILIVLLVRGLTLEGYWKGIEFYVIPKPEKLLDASVWGSAATQIFYSLGPGFGGLLTMASYNKFKNNCYRDAILVAVINCGTSVFAGFAIFSLLGFMAHRTNQPVDSVVDEGSGLAFIAYPEGLSRLPAAPVWSFLFFFMLLTLGMDSQFAMMETVISAFTDMFPRVLRRNKLLFTLFCCAIGFLLGIPLVTEGGIHVFTIFNWYSGSYGLMLVSLAEIICVSYVYGVKRFMKDIEMMIGFQPNYYWLVMWFFLTPVVIVFIVVASAVQFAPASYAKKVYPDWAQGLGWLMVAAPVAMIIITAIIQVLRLGLKNAIRPTAEWGPAEPEDRVGRYARTDDPTVFINDGFEGDNAVKGNPYIISSKGNNPSNGDYQMKTLSPYEDGQAMTIGDYKTTFTERL